MQYILFTRSSTLLHLDTMSDQVLQLKMRSETSTDHINKSGYWHWVCKQLLICCCQGFTSLMRTTICNQQTYSNIITLSDLNHRARKHIPYFFHHTPVSKRHYLVQGGQHLIQQVSRKSPNKTVAIKTSPSLKLITSALVFPHTILLVDPFWLKK